MRLVLRLTLLPCSPIRQQQKAEPRVAKPKREESTDLMGLSEEAPSRQDPEVDLMGLRGGAAGQKVCF